ncbi:hypothetical protein JAAARDRAFT_189747 [Jaapia argillacea MUCL 33604]|uniref:Uncharacterized protein n=1 Tax=Jaapia argillacea MUCL 33604 TaxID=933084 RepID=A0A067Q8H5_9AGAM|nr:hypothetical protein JAAARDRAFT_189747 [Jaapia argillacea MUCL 33604]
MEEDTVERKFFATFDKLDVVLEQQNLLLSIDFNCEPSAEEDRSEHAASKSLSLILDEYQEQSYLLDPFLERLIPPIVDKLRTHAACHTSNPTQHTSLKRLRHIPDLLHNYIKCRGYKTIIRFFPHEVADLPIALDYMLLKDGPAQTGYMWSLRYIFLLWLSLICMIPFGLSQFDEGDVSTGTTIEKLARHYLGYAGLERDGAALLLSRLYIRQDTGLRFPNFLHEGSRHFEGSGDVITTICEVMNAGSAEEVQVNVFSIYSVARAVEANATLMSNTVVRKFCTKLISRLALRLLPAAKTQDHCRARTLVEPHEHALPHAENSQIDVPDEVETVLTALFSGLQDRDTVVRWSAAKGIARIAERLPEDFADQVFGTVLELFAVHGPAAVSLSDLPAVAEGTWHGACLACAEIARRGLVTKDRLQEFVDWLAKALYFDIRKGAHSIGSNVRDAAAYALWSLARGQSVENLAVYADTLSRSLVTVALFDREIHIRRAASAAFQEYVGRTSLFPHGIDVLRKTDFYAVGVRRNSFLVAVPQVAEHSEYRPFLIQHLLDVTLRHWDSSMRQLGAQSLRAICDLDLAASGSGAMEKAARLLECTDISDVHGGLLAISELASSYGNSSYGAQFKEQREKAFCYLRKLPITTLLVPRNEIVTAVACYLIANSISEEDIQREPLLSSSHWNEIVDIGLRHRSSAVQEAATSALTALSNPDRDVVFTLIPQFRTSNPTLQQSLARLLGELDYGVYLHNLPQAIECLLASVNPSSPERFTNVEARRNCYKSMQRLFSTVSDQLVDRLSSSTVSLLFEALLMGMEDYTVDERGDVVLFSKANTLQNFEEYLPSSQYHAAIGAILKQGVERLDNVRQVAGECFHRLLLCPLPLVPNHEAWRIKGDTFMKELFVGEGEDIGWNEGSWLFPKAVQLLGVELYRQSILSGLVLSVGSRTDSTQRPVSSSLVDYARSLTASPVRTEIYDICSLAEDLIHNMKSNLNSNAVIIPNLQTFNVLLEGDAFEMLSGNARGIESLQTILKIASKNASRLKNVQRIHASMRMYLLPLTWLFIDLTFDLSVVNLLCFSATYSSAVLVLPEFLTHRFPKIRTDTVEYLYMVLQSKDLARSEFDEAEEILLETEWNSPDGPVVEEAAHRLVGALSL